MYHEAWCFSFTELHSSRVGAPLKDPGCSVGVGAQRGGLGPARDGTALRIWSMRPFVLAWEAQCSLRGHACLRYVLKVWPEPKQQDKALKVSPSVAISCIPDFRLETDGWAPSCLQLLCLFRRSSVESLALGNEQLPETHQALPSVSKEDGLNIVGVSHNALFLTEFL